jgi:hypothetical protein
MKFKTTLLILLFPVLLLNAKCNKDKPEAPSVLPPITQEGKNTFGCKVNGEVWVPYYKCGGTGNPCGEIAVDVYPLIIQNKLPVQIDINVGKRNKDNSQTFFQINTKQGIGLYTTGNKIDSLKIEFYGLSGSLIPYTNNIGSNSSVNKFEITKLDTVNRIISGIFEGTLFKSLSDSVRISEGRFDLRFTVCKCSN